MARVVDVEGLRELLDRGAQLVEVLPAYEYDELHLPGAVSLPLKELDAERANRLERGRPVVVYCWDALCDLSPRAATRLALLGFDAYDYAVGKVDWMARALPLEGSLATRPTALSFLRDDVATCDLTDPASRIRPAIEASPYGFALVLYERIVLGRVLRSSLDGADEDTTAELLMEPGPSTTRPDLAPAELAKKLDSKGFGTAILTTPEGELFGVVRRSDLPPEG
jgi:rhodanese-related sulfurtransferase